MIVTNISVTYQIGKSYDIYGDWTSTATVNVLGQYVLSDPYGRHYYIVDIICPPPSWNRVKVADKTW